MHSLRTYFLWLTPILSILSIFGYVQELEALWKLSFVLATASLAIGVGSLKVLEKYQYTFWIIAAVFSGLLYPEFFLNIGGFDLRNKWLVLIVVQLVMFGMGTQMSIKDFTGITKSAKAVAIGLVAQFTIMPIIGFTIAKTYNFEPEVAAGIVLIGCCSSGLASNVMTYIAKGDLALSITVTAISTLLAPITTTFLMKLFAGTFIEINFMDMMIEIVKIVLVPLTAAMIHDALKSHSNNVRKAIFFSTGLAAVWLVIVVLFGQSTALNGAADNFLVVVNFISGAFVVGTVYNMLYRAYHSIDKIMPYFSMFGIVYFTLVTTAAGSENLIRIGGLLLVAAILHNTGGYFVGYWLSRLCGLDKRKSQTIAFEVGLQNGGMASGLAGSMGKLATLGLAAAVFSPWMNISGSLLANYWRTKRDNKQKEIVIKTR